MWTRYLIKCNSCDKITNLRIQIPERTEMPITFNCVNCSSEIRAKLIVDFENASWDFTVERGTLIDGNILGGDYFFEFSDTLATNSPSVIPHDKVLPTLRMPTSDFEKIKTTKDLRKFHSNEDWENFKDLVRAYVSFNKNVIERLVKKIGEGIFPTEIFQYDNDLDYNRNYFLTLNYLVYPWIDFDNHEEFIKWLNKNIFTKANLSNPDLNDYVTNILSDTYCQKLKEEMGDLTVRFVELREFFLYANNEQDSIGVFAGNQDFTKLKNFFTDCYEFIGRTSHLIFRLQNFHERGSQNNLPIGSPRNVTSADDFSSLNHGDKLDILKLSNEIILKLPFIKSFDNKLRNGINHFKAKLNTSSQIISYYPITKRPDEEYRIKYIDFLNVLLDSFNTVLKIGQLLKFILIYKRVLSERQSKN
jgi:hypothetical protein